MRCIHVSNRGLWEHVVSGQTLNILSTAHSMLVKTPQVNDCVCSLLPDQNIYTQNAPAM